MFISTHFNNNMQLDSVRASASGAVDSGLILILFKPVTFKLVFTASLLDAQHYRKMENKPASFLVVLLVKAVGEIPHLGAINT